MTPRIEAMLSQLRQKTHHRFRRDFAFPEPVNSPEQSRTKTVALSLRSFLQAQTPVLLPDSRIAFLRTVRNLPKVLTEQQMQQDRQAHFIHEAGRVSNICPNYARIIGLGLEHSRLECETALAGATLEEADFLQSVIWEIDAVLELSQRYRQLAEAQGNPVIAQTLAQVPAKPARSFLEALQFFRILHFTLWSEGEYHNTVGRFDQYMLPYLMQDLESGVLTVDSAFELLEEFFITFNYDSDLYPGVQQGDNGQSMMLGGMTPEGKEGFNLLSEMCLKASMELCLIDPKINLRVSKHTPLSVFELGTRLTEKGLGFPQYSNDDVVIPGLMALGYEEADARDYTVAACWEFIIPNVGMDIPNIGAVNFPKLADECIRQDLPDCESFAELMARFRRRVQKDCNRIVSSIQNVYMIPAPFMSLLMDGCVERKRDISLGSKYNNYGLHGVGISAAVDSLAAVKIHVFDRKAVTPERLVQGLQNEFSEDASLFHLLRYESPKLGNDDQEVNEILDEVLTCFADALSGKVNDRGGCIRAGTGSAMFYLWYADELGCLANGHKRGEGFGANYAPELSVKNKGPVSVARSMARPALRRAINGGPLTMEIYSGIFGNPDSITKVASIVKYFMDLGGHQLQINAVNAETLRQAQAHPEDYQNLIVRIWGWSAYFVELDREYQEHVIARQEFRV